MSKACACVTVTFADAAGALARAPREAMLPWMSRVPRLVAGPGRAAGLALAILTAGLAGCSDDGGGTLECVTDVDFATCQPLYQPTWENVHANTITRSCSTGGLSCHARAGAQGNVVLGDAAQSYQALLDGGYLLPGNAACSELVMRLYTDDRDLLMPRGARLPDAEACAIGQWVAQGAQP